tara:strand:+ start:18973 stop:19401 length:429 start_codon:yes stop_codon:yes gene_type:complete
MNSYNGFTANQRMKAFKWLMEKITRKEIPPKPDKCDVCGQTKGHIEYHSEDYSAPFGEHIGQFGLCYTCHLMIHCRKNSKSTWLDYIQSITDGKRYEPFYYKAWVDFKQKCLIDKFANMKYEIVEGNNSEILTNIEKGVYIK